MADKEIRELAHLYVDGAFNRRELVRRARKIAGGVAGVSLALDAMGVPLKAQQMCSSDLRIPADAPDLMGEDIEYPGEAGMLKGYLVRPRRTETTPMAAVVVIHENRGLNEHIRDVTRRVARAGFVALGVDLLSRQGGSAQFTEPTQQTQAYGRTLPAERLADLKSSVAHLRTLTDVRRNRIGTVGFCAGGANVWALAASGEDTTANVVYYGAPPPADQVANIKGAMLCHYAERDRNLSINGGPMVASLIQNNKTFGFFVWEGVGHAFNNDTGAAFDAQTACEAWAKTIDFFSRHLNREDD